MKPKDAFGVVVRTIGLILVFTGALYLLSALVVCVAPAFRPNLSPAWHYLAHGVIGGLFGLYFLRGAPGIVRFAYPNEKSDSAND
jgi:hypothetical protein